MNKSVLFPCVQMTLSLLTICPIPAISAEYECTISSVLELNEKGQYVTHGWEGNYINRKYYVDRDSGKVTGTTALKARLVNFNKVYSPKVLHYGSHEKPFVSITLFEDTGEFTVLRINEDAETSEKPGYYQTAIGMLLTGTCTGTKP